MSADLVRDPTDELVVFSVPPAVLDLPPDLRAFRDAFAFGLVILVLIVRPSGLIRARGLIERV